MYAGRKFLEALAELYLRFCCLQITFLVSSEKSETVWNFSVTGTLGGKQVSALVPET
jgi:hypothetical protein